MSDPRFDPAFQRGYSGPEPTLVARPQASPSRQTIPDVAEPAIARAPVAPTPPGPAEPTAELALEEPWQQPRRNPFAIALLASGLIMLVLGIAMIWSTATAQNSTDTQATYDTAAQALSIVDYLLPPALLLGGILGLLAWLILGALGPSQRRDSRR